MEPGDAYVTEITIGTRKNILVIISNVHNILPLYFLIINGNANAILTIISMNKKSAVII